MYKAFLKKYKYQLLLFFIVLVLFIVNYKPGTYLSGWDNLQTELNPGLAVKRAFNSVWEEYQSFGLTAGMAHAADLPRAVFLWIMSYELPQNMIRYFYHFFMLFLGGLGMFTLLESLGFIEILGLLGALFFMFNLGTVQIFYLPYEPFTTFFAFLPWAVWSFIQLFHQSTISRKDLITFFLINILGTPAFYTQQLFIVYLLILSCLAIRFVNIKDKTSIKKILIAFLLIVSINSFWILPQLYFLKSNDHVIYKSKTNQLSTENVYYQNYEKGTLNDFLKLEGYYFDLKGVNSTFLFAPWKNHFNNHYIGYISYIFEAIVILGLWESIRKKKNVGFVFVFLVCASALLLVVPPFSWINDLLRKISVINQIFRSPFTKFIIPYSFIYSYFIVVGISVIIRTLKKKTSYLLITLCFLLIFLYSLPSFQGYFFSSEIKITIPNDYFQIMDYFKTEGKNKRIALLPDYTFWGWFFNKWGYNGSGFFWYGIEQPVVSRTFDVWNRSSEGYFWEIKTALEAEDSQKITNVFDKYQIDYLILDKSLIPVVSSYKALQYDRINNLLLENPNISTVFNGQNISLYKIEHKYPSKNFVGLSTSLNNIGPQINITNDDTAYSENGLYATKQNQANDIYYPFLSLTSQNNLSNNWQISEDENYFYVSTSLPFDPNNFNVSYNNQYQETIFIDDQPINMSLNIQPIIENNKLTVRMEKKAIKYFDVNIDQKNKFTFSDQSLSQNIGYLVKTNSLNTSGLPLYFYIEDNTKKQGYLEDRLHNQINYFILPPRYQYGLGYTFSFQNQSFKNLNTSNKLKELSLYLFPYKGLKEIMFVRKGFNKTEVQYSNNFEAKKINYFTYKITTHDSKIVVLNQSYDLGWIAISSGKKLDHILVNNWANGWLLPQDSKPQEKTNIIIIFWPQYLEFIGFGLLVISFLYIVFIKPKKEENA